MKRLVLTETASRELGPNAVVGTDLARSAGTHRVVGYDTYSGKFYPKRQKFIVYVALSLDGGIILGRVEFSEDNHFAGPILSGAGKFRGVEGRITGRSLGDDGGRTFVRLRYHF